MKIGIIGFGRFGQFLAKEFVNYGWNVYATSRSDYTHIANELNVTFLILLPKTILTVLILLM